VFLERIRNFLKSGEFRPVPVRQVMIEKQSAKLRKLGMACGVLPPFADRLVIVRVNHDDGSFAIYSSLLRLIC
jgi:hypothetical protein